MSPWRRTCTPTAGRWPRPTCARAKSGCSTSSGAAWECPGEPKAREAYTRRVIFGELTEEEKAEKQLRAIFEAERLLTLAQRELGSQRYPQAAELLRQALEQVSAAPAGPRVLGVRYGQAQPGALQPRG